MTTESLEALARLVHAIDTVESWGSLGDDPLFAECFAAARKLTVGVTVWPRFAEASTLHAAALAAHTEWVIEESDLAAFDGQGAPDNDTLLRKAMRALGALLHGGVQRRESPTPVVEQVKAEFPNMHPFAQAEIAAEREKAADEASTACKLGAWGGPGCLEHEGYDIGADGLCVGGRGRTAPPSPLREAWDRLRTEIATRVPNHLKSTQFYEALNDVEGGVRAAERAAPSVGKAPESQEKTR